MAYAAVSETQRRVSSFGALASEWVVRPPQGVVKPPSFAAQYLTGWLLEHPCPWLDKSDENLH